MRFTAYTVLLVLTVAASSWAAFGLVGLFFGTLVCILALLLMGIRSILVALLCFAAIVLVIALLLPMVSAARESARYMTCSCNMKQIGLSLYEYHQNYKCLPPAYVADETGKPMHSWRVLILPFMEQQQAYDRYRFDEPWDGPNNRKLVDEQQRVFECPSDHRDRRPEAPYTYSNYLAVVGPNTAWLGKKPRSLDDPELRGKGHSTVLAVESANTDIRWSEPKDMVADARHAVNAQPIASSPHMRPADSYFLSDAPMANAVMADASVRPIPFGIAADSPIFQVGGCTDEALHDLWETPINWSHCIGLPVFVISIGLLFYHAIRKRRAW